MGYLHLAGHAPGGPHIDVEHLAAQVAQLMRFAVDIAEGLFRSHLAGSCILQRLYLRQVFIEKFCVFGSIFRDGFPEAVHILGITL